MRDTILFICYRRKTPVYPFAYSTICVRRSLQIDGRVVGQPAIRISELFDLNMGTVQMDSMGWNSSWYYY